MSSKNRPTLYDELTFQVFKEKNAGSHMVHFLDEGRKHSGALPIQMIEWILTMWYQTKDRKRGDF